MVYLSTKFLGTTRPTRKLDHKYVGPFRIKKVIGRVTYELELPEGMDIHPVVHVSLLERAETDQIDGRQQQQPHRWAHSGEDEYEVDHIVTTERDDDGNLLYKVRWKGYTEEDDT